MKIDELISKGIAARASDWHFKTGEPVAFRVGGNVCRNGGGALDADACARYLSELTGEQVAPDAWGKRLFTPLDRTVTREIEERRVRLRLHAKRSRAGIGFNLRHIAEKPISMDELQTPHSFRELLRRESGLILVTGQTGSGKSTTLAAGIDFINATREGKIISYEAPVEIEHPSQKCLVEQHEVGLGEDIASFEEAAVSAMREDPDVVMFGELRTPEVIRLALEVADTGHLVLGTMHTGDATQSVSRLIGAAPEGEKSFYLNKIATNLLGTLSQRLIPAKRESNGESTKRLLRANYELMIVNEAIFSNINTGEFAQIPNAIVTGRKSGMFTFDDHLADLVAAKEYTAEEALNFVPNPMLTLRTFAQRRVVNPAQEQALKKRYG